MPRALMLARVVPASPPLRALEREERRSGSGAPLFAYEGVLKHFLKATPERGQALRELLATAERYGASGTPDAVGEPSGTDRLEDVARSGTAGARARTRPSTVDMLETYNKLGIPLNEQNGSRANIELRVS